MSDQPKTPEGTEGDESVTPPDDNAGNDSNQSVSYETHRRLLSEKKREAERRKALEDELTALKAKEKEAQEAELKEQNRWKELHDQKTQELQDAKSKLQQTERERLEAKKLAAVLEALPGEVPNQYWGLVDCDKVIIGDDGTVEASSVAAYAQEFQKTYPHVVEVRGRSRIPSEAPPGKSNTGTLTKEEWMKLPAKERNARVGEISDVPDWMKSKPQIRNFSG